MRFKTDENLHEEVAALLRGQGHDAVTVRDEKLAGKPDDVIAVVCRREERILVTSDKGFGDVRRYPPGDHPEIILFRLARQSRRRVRTALESILPLLSPERLTGRLLVVDEASARLRGAVLVSTYD